MISNTYLRMQVENMLQTLNAFDVGCDMAVRQDDGVMDRQEEKMLKTLKKATDTFRKELNSLMK